MLEQFGREGDLQRYAAARRRMAIAQVLVCAVATHALFGFWPATVLVSGALYAAAWTAWRHGGWLYAKTRRRSGTWIASARTTRSISHGWLCL